MKKAELRKIFKERRRQLDPVWQGKMDDLLLISFQRLGLDIPSCILTYSAIEKFNEFDPHLITNFCSFKNPLLQLMYPVMGTKAGDWNMNAMLVNEETEFRMNEYGIAEPINGVEMDISEIDLVIVPLLCFDERGYRLGYGKGAYDRFLASCREDCIKLGFSYFDPITEIEDINAYDIPLDIAITPNQFFTFK